MVIMLIGTLQGVFPFVVVDFASFILIHWSNSFGTNKDKAEKAYVVIASKEFKKRNSKVRETSLFLASIVENINRLIWSK